MSLTCQLSEGFRGSGTPNPDSIVKSGFTVSTKIHMGRHFFLRKNFFVDANEQPYEIQNSADKG